MTCRAIATIVGLLIASSAGAQTATPAPDMRGTWSAPDGTLVTIEQRGERIDGRVLAPTLPMTEKWGWQAGDRLLTGTVDASNVSGAAFVHFAVSLQGRCPAVGNPATDLELQAVSDTQMIGRFRVLVLKNDCTLVQGPWAPAEFTRQPFSLRAAKGELAIALPEAILFDVNRAELMPTSLAVLRDVKQKVIDQQRFTRLTIEGHTDDRGSAAYNDDLSARRAQAVAAWLVDAGVEGAIVSAKGVGERQPIADNRTSANRARNRRVEIRLQP